MAVTIGSRLSKPEDWTQTEPGEWSIEYPMKTSRGLIHVTRVAFGEKQCLVCGEPIMSKPGEIPYCHDCDHALWRYKNGRAVSRRWAKRLEEFLECP